MKYRILTITEYEKYKLNIPNPRRRFWLDPSGFPSDGHFPVVNDDGMKAKFGELPDNGTVGLRPVIEYGEDEEKQFFSAGDRLELYGYKWTAVSDRILVCDSVIGDYKFADEPKLFKDSYLCYMLYQIFNEKHEEHTRKLVKGSTGAKLVNSNSQSLKALYSKSREWKGSHSSQLFTGSILTAAGVAVAGLGLGTFFQTPGLNIVWKLALAVGLVGIGLFNVLRAVYKHGKASEEYFNNNVSMLASDAESIMGNTGNVSTNQISDDFRFASERINEKEIRDRFELVNNLIDRIISTKKKVIRHKLEDFYVPETQKLYDISMEFAADGVDSPKSRECRQMVKDSLDKTIQLLTIEYDKANENRLQDVSFNMGVKQKMLDLNEAENKMTVSQEKLENLPGDFGMSAAVENDTQLKL